MCCASFSVPAIVIHAQLLQRHNVSTMMSHVQCKCDEIMMMSYLHHANAKQTMMMWCSSNVNTYDIMPPHSYMA